MSYGVNNIRFGGIASGLDTEKIVKDLMRLEQIKVDRVVQEKQLLEWKRSDYREINTKLLALRNSVFDLKLQSSFLAREVVSSDESVVQGVSVNAGATLGNYEIEVVQLAKGASYQSTPADGFSAVDGSFTIAGSKGSAEITLGAGETVQNVVDKINDAADTTGVKAVYDEDLNRLFLMSADTGDAAAIKFTASDAGGKTNLENLLGGTFNEGSEVTLSQGQNALIRINGGDDISFASNQVKVIGLTLNLKSKGTATVSVNQDIDAAVDKIKAFVENYNAVMEKIDTKLTEKRYRDYPPLTDEQKKEMKENEIELWEEKARSGLLNSDPMLRSIYSQIRMTAMDAVSGIESNYKTLNSIGINTLSWNDHGKLYVDEEKLREALSEDIEGVMALFTNEAENGIAQKLYDTVNNSINSIVAKAGRDDYKVDNSTLGKEILEQTEKIFEMQEKMAEIEERYWKQFTAMEKALARMQSQSDWLMAQLS
ncbi:flagellar filament capping protein FliD [Thermosyntropha sp.]|uniref:flagellar filament capping protein FliD n=1 Tax=Thermosyntropha sp. TaxID=2740820 RepID=UPI0025F65B8B|nr:flagellar filament capping protein FliD [Thermosyntropha sp.]MBO8159038.1 flagellar filament capping protein FliD [Thermosyntropha sp.]